VLSMALITLLAGVTLGLRFRALILVPTMATVIALVFAVEVARSEPLRSLVLTLAATVASLQIGYFAGALLRHALPSSRHGSVRRGALAEAQPANAASDRLLILHDN
jgi:hypothetical protein